MGCTISGIREQDTLCKRIKFLADNYPDRELFIFYDSGVRDAYTSIELFDLGGKFAALLTQQGFKRHDVIANTLPNSPERLVTDYGIIMAGCVAMNGQLVRADGADFYDTARKSRCKCVVANLEDDGPAAHLFRPGTAKSDADDEPGCFRAFCNDSAPEMTTVVNVFRNGDS